MLPRLRRLTSDRDIRAVRRSRRRASGRLFSLQAAAHDEKKGKARIAVIVSRGVSKRSVDRHRVARVARAAVRELLPFIPDGIDLVVIAHRPPTEYALTTSREDLTVLLQRLHLYRES